MMPDQPAYVIEQDNGDHWVAIGYGWDRERVIHQAELAANEKHPTRVRSNDGKHAMLYESAKDI
jgi:hypothetical protein